MSGEKFDKELAELYQQRKQQIDTPAINVSNESTIQAPARSIWSMLALLLSGGIASFGIMAIVTHFAKPSVHGDMEQFKQHSVKIIELPKANKSAPVVSPTLPLPPQPKAIKPTNSLEIPQHKSDIAINQPDISLDKPSVIDLAMPSVQQPTFNLEPVHRVLPDYPKKAIFSRLSGQVKLGYRINTRGEVVDIITLGERSHKMLDRSAKRALAQWRYTPETSSKKMLEVMFEFNLEQ